ncbi:MAG: hypothetical protein KAX40_10865 [Herpetosiphon sp.]|nr:hypothetical protein [Herpetosiphon sp.]
MNQELLWQQYRLLPQEAQHQVNDFIAFLQTRYATVEPVVRTKLIDEPFIGMWADREDMTDSTAWVRSIRQKEWHDPQN